MEAITRRFCIVCRAGFEVSPAEVQYLTQLAEQRGWRGLVLPKRCVSCRLEKSRREQRPDEVLLPGSKPIQMVCGTCGAQYLFGVRDQEFFEERGWAPPKNCKPCRVARQARFAGA